jgi:hypothetical protein
MAKSRSQSRFERMPVVNAHAAGIDIGSQFHVRAVLAYQPVTSPFRRLIPSQKIYSGWQSGCARVHYGKL